MKLIKKRIEYIRFLDHCSHVGIGSHPLECEAMGMVVFEDKLQVRLASWVTCSEIDNDNNEVYTILKSTIINRRRFKL